MLAMVAVTAILVCWIHLWESSNATLLAAWPVCLDEPRCQMIADYGQENEYHYIVEGNEMSIKIVGNSFEIVCGEKLNIESASLPRFLQAKAFTRVTVKKCAVPQNRITSYDEVLAALNVTVFKELAIDSPVMDCSLTLLRHQHFARLNLETLRIHNEPFSFHLNLTYDCFTYIRALKELILQNVNLPATTSIEMTNDLQSLSIRDSWPLPVMLKSVKSLKVLETMKNKDKQELSDFVECDKLETIAVTAPFTRSLPDRWLVNCNNLKEILLNKLGLKNFPSKIVSEKNSLRNLKVSSCGLRELSENSFINMAELRFLDLSKNLLTNLQRKVFKPLLHLEELNLSKNRLRMLGDSLSPLTKLRHLSLTNNPLGDVCSPVGDISDLSVFADIPSLEYLILKRTQITRLCPDWRSNMPHLKRLDLTHNKISRLQYNDLLFLGNEKMQVNISDNPVKQIMFSKLDYDHALRSKYRERDEKVERKRPVSLFLEAEIECDCNAYWFARIQCAREDLSSSVARIHGIRCQDGRALCEVDSGTTLCAIGECTQHCTCKYRASDNATVATCSWPTASENNSTELPRGDLLVVYAERSGLINLPNAPNAMELHLRWNLIRTIHPENIYENLRLLDLRFNDIRRVNLDAANAIFSNCNRRIWLSGNPLACDCQDRSSLESLRTHSVQIADYGELQCADARFVRDINLSGLCDSRDFEVLLSILMGSLAFVSLVIVLVKVNYNRIVNISNLLFNSNYQCSDRKQSEKRYDIFISFSYENMNFVKEKLLPWLEDPSRSYRVCVNYRDWEVPELIHTLITGSVRDSSCTVVVLSEQYLKSKWTRRTEFRTAQAAAMLDDSKLVVILLRPAAELRRHLDHELRTYLEANTYLVWGDRWFWKKLQAALPPPTTFSNLPINSSDSSSQQTCTIDPSVSASPCSATDKSQSTETSVASHAALCTASAPFLLSVSSFLQSEYTDYAKSGYPASSISFLPSITDKFALPFTLTPDCAQYPSKGTQPLFNLSSNPTMRVGV